MNKKENNGSNKASWSLSVKELLKFFDLSQDLLCIADADGYIQAINPAFSKTLGYAEKIVLSKSLLEFVHPDDQEASQAEFSKLKAGVAKIHLENRYRCKDESYKWLNWICRSDPETGTLHAVARDVTAQRKVQAQLEETAYTLRWAQERVHLGSFKFDTLFPERDTWSEEMYRIVGRSSQTRPVTHTEIASKIVHKEDRIRFSDAFIQSIEDAVPLDIEHRIVRPNGALRYVSLKAEPITNAEGRVVQILGTILDITEQKHAENRHQKDYEQIKAILDTTVDAIITISEQGTVLSFNKAAAKIFGFEAEEIIGQNVKSLMPSPYHEEHDGYIHNYVETGHRKIIGIGREVVGRRKDGSVFPMELAVSEIKLDHTRIFTGLVRDISERRQLELEILRISEYERQNIGQELHDGLGSQLSGIGMICQLLARKLKKAEHPGASDVAEIAEQVKEADYLARNIARGLVPVPPEPGGLRQALHRLAETTERTYGITCTVKEEGEVLVEDNAVSTHLYRIAQEAFSNAVRHGKPGRIVARLAIVDDELILEVIDDGIGIPDTLPKEKGVGLRTMKHRASVIRGKLSVKRGEKQGTVVSCRLHSFSSVA
ncbi:MAG: PAS domain S-box protein [Rhodothermaceae bacterium]|nr:PAS domain S-box protein [Rhodothermaceae bacterium]